MSVVPEVEMSDDASILNNDTVLGIHGAGRQPALTGCPWHDVNEMLQAAGLRPTRQRMALGWLLFGKGARHLTAEMLYEEATLAKVPVSLATVYNTLNQLTDAGLLRQVSVDGTKTYFDTNVIGTSPLLSREQSRTGRHSRPASGAAEDAAKFPRATRSPASTWSCGCARSAESFVVAGDTRTITTAIDDLKRLDRCQREAHGDGSWRSPAMTKYLRRDELNPPSRRRRHPTAAAVRSSHRSRCR